MGIHLDNQPPVERVEELTDHPTDVPSDDADWASMNSSTILSLQNDHAFPEAGIAFITSDEYDHGYQYGTTIRTQKVRGIQEDVGLFEYFDPDEHGIVVSDEKNSKYSLEGMIRSLFHTVITDSYLQSTGEETVDDFTIEYTYDESAEWYRVLFLW